VRDIKFRGKRIDTHEWVYGYYSKSVENKSYICTDFSYRDHVMPFITLYEVIPETVGPYISLDDKNGKEIYKGDIVNCSFENRGIGVIGFSLNNQQTMIYKNCSCDMPICDLDYLIASFCEVIGNIHDNQDLLKK